MKIEFFEQYDQEDDVYYVSFRTGEPSVVQEHDDTLMVEVGMFSGMPTGFRILKYTKHKTAANNLIQDMKALFQKVIEAAESRIKAESAQRENRLTQFFEKAIA